MIEYSWGAWGLALIFRLRGSVFPKAIVFAVPNALVALLLHRFLSHILYHKLEGLDKIWSGYTFVLCFLIVFRTNQAYNRFWEGATLIQQVRGEWFNAVSSAFAFCNPDERKRKEVEHFQQLLVRLMSMLYCSALQQVCDLTDDSLEIIDVGGLDEVSLAFMSEAPDRCEVLLQWIQRLLADAGREDIISIPPPILSRAYQELSRGIVNLIDIRKIREIPFPFPYAQMISAMLVLHWLVTPLLTTAVIRGSSEFAGLVAFCVTAAFWSLVFIAAEIDQPFGEDYNDLNIMEMQKDMNLSLLTLLEQRAQQPPTFNLKQAIRCTALKPQPARMSSLLGTAAFSMSSLSSSASSVVNGLARSNTIEAQNGHVLMRANSAEVGPQADALPMGGSVLDKSDPSERDRNFTERERAGTGEISIALTESGIDRSSEHSTEEFSQVGSNISIRASDRERLRAKKYRPSERKLLWRKNVCGYQTANFLDITMSGELEPVNTKHHKRQVKYSVVQEDGEGEESETGERYKDGNHAKSKSDLSLGSGRSRSSSDSLTDPNRGGHEREAAHSQWPSEGTTEVPPPTQSTLHQGALSEGSVVQTALKMKIPRCQPRPLLEHSIVSPVQGDALADEPILM